MAQIHRTLMQQGLHEARLAAAGDRDEVSRIEAAYAVMSDELGNMEMAHTGFAMCALPHKHVGDAVWERDGGSVKMLVESGLDRHKNPIGIPYGSIARMILLYLQTEAVKTRSREIELGKSMNSWLRAMNIPIGGKTYALVKEQARRISRCRLTFFKRNGALEFVSNGAFVRDSILLDPNASDQPMLWKETVLLDEGFYESLIEHPLPLREQAIRQISGDSLVIDLYVWLAYRLHALDKSLPITWQGLRPQFGGGYSEIRFFKRRMKERLPLALAVYPEANVEINDDGVVLHPSAPPVPERKKLLI